jgi:hypothetical protein
MGVLALASIPFKLPAPRPGDGLVEPAQSGSSIGAMGGTTGKQQNDAAADSDLKIATTASHKATQD